MASALRPYEERAQRVFGALGQTVVLPKGLARSLPQFSRVPRYVAEFLLARALPKGEGAADVADYLALRHPSPQDRELWRHRLVQRGTLGVVDLVEVRVDMATGAHLARLESLGLVSRMAPETAERHPGLLTGGLWGFAHLTWIPDEHIPVALQHFVPVQASVRLDLVLEGRPYFEADAWVDLLLASAGYDPQDLVRDLGDPAAGRRQKLLYLARLAPLVEPNLNLLELGPKNTGKTYLLRNVSPRAYVVSGGRATPASLFVNLATGRHGLLADRKVVVFDEVARLSLGSGEGVAILKDFLESGSFGRGTRLVRSDCSVVFTGNIEVEGGLPSGRYRHLVEPLPREFRDSAFVDRLHGFIPGWELPKLRPASFAEGLGFVSDFFGEMLYRLRELPYAKTYEALVDGRPLLPGATQRDAAALERLARALFKMVFPVGAGPRDRVWVEDILLLAGDLRQRVHDQLCRIAPGEFAARRVGWDLGGAASPAPAPLPSVAPFKPRPGEVFFLDYVRLGEGGEAILRPVEASVLPVGRGLRPPGHVGSEGTQALRAVYGFLLANWKALGLPPDWLAERTLAVDLPGGPLGDGRSLGLAACIAMAQALHHERALLPVAAAGGATLHGRLALPDHLEDRLHALPPGPGRLVLPKEAEGLVPEIRDASWTCLFVRDLAEVLAGVG